MHILITGGTGLVGSHLVPELLADGHQVTVMVRRQPGSDRPSNLPGLQYLPYGPGNQIPEGVAPVDAVINLAGAGIADHRWTPDYKQTILKSRVDTTMECVRLLRRQAEAGHPAQVFVSASAVGYYGTQTPHPVDETAPPGGDFLSVVGRRWEAAAADAGVRTVITRFGVILAKEGGAFPKLLAPFKLFAGGYIGDGQQGFPWVHVDDVVGALKHALTHPAVQGPVNVVAPELHTNASFGKLVGKVLERPAGLPVPVFVVKAMLGESHVLVTEGQQVLAQKLISTGYRFRWPRAEDAIRDLVK